MNAIQKTSQLENLKYSLCGMLGDLRHLPQNHGDRSFCEAAAQSLQAEIAELEAIAAKPCSNEFAIQERATELYHEYDIEMIEAYEAAEWEIEVGGQVVYPASKKRVETVNEKTEDAEAPATVIEVDKQLVDRLFDFLNKKAAMWKRNNRQRVWYTESVGDYISIYKMITQGVKGGKVSGLKQISKMQDYMTMLNALLRLSAVLLIATAPVTIDTTPEPKLSRITETQIDEFIERILSHQTTVG